MTAPAKNSPEFYLEQTDIVISTFVEMMSIGVRPEDLKMFIPELMALAGIVVTDVDLLVDLALMRMGKNA